MSLTNKIVKPVEVVPANPVPDHESGLPGWITTGDPVSLTIILSSACWMLFNRGLPALWRVFTQDSEREERRFDELLSWVKEYVVSTQANLSLLSHTVAKQQEAIDRIERLLLLNSQQNSHDNPDKNG